MNQFSEQYLYPFFLIASEHVPDDVGAVVFVIAVFFGRILIGVSLPTGINCHC